MLLICILVVVCVLGCIEIDAFPHRSTVSSTTRRKKLIDPTHPTTVKDTFTIVTMTGDKDNTVQDATSAGIDRQTIAGKKGHVSARGASNLALPMAYLADFFTCLDDMCHPQDNPQGHIPVCVAENKLVTDLLQARLATDRTVQAGYGDDVEVYSYGSPLGLQVMKEAVAKILQERFLLEPLSPSTTKDSATNDSQQSTSVISPDHIAIGAGAINLLNNLFFALGNSGDAVLIPAPYYAAFDNDLRAYAGCVAVPVTCQDPTKGPTTADLDAAKVHAESTLGLKVRFLLLTHPHNPLGVVYEPHVMKDSIAWARSHSMDTVVDEIYALSVFDTSDTAPTFESILKLFQNDLGNDVHLVWGLSKDFGASGFRIGVVYTQNELLMESLGNLITFAWVSHPMQRMMADLLQDDTFCDSFLQESSRRLQQSYTICTDVFQVYNIPHVPAQAGMFVYLDLSDIIQTTEEEATVSKLFMTRARMVLTPGTTQHDPKPGMFRICYAYVSPDVLRLGMERFRKVVTTIRENGGLGDWIEDDSHWQGIL